MLKQCLAATLRAMPSVWWDWGTALALARPQLGRLRVTLERLAVAASQLMVVQFILSEEKSITG
jgi:hypothetical protein